MKNQIFFVIGASGSGKTSTLKAFERAIPQNCQLIHFDDIGVPTFEEMVREFGSIEEWQRIKTHEWIKKLSQEQLKTSNIIFDAQIRSSFIEEACREYQVDYKIVLFDCSDQERKRRLIARGNSELANTEMMNWSKFLRNDCQNRQSKIIDNSSLSLEETLILFNQWLQNQLLKDPIN